MKRIARGEETNTWYVRWPDEGCRPLQHWAKPTLWSFCRTRQAEDGPGPNLRHHRRHSGARFPTHPCRCGPRLRRTGGIPRGRFGCVTPEEVPWSATRSFAAALESCVKSTVCESGAVMTGATERRRPLGQLIVDGSRSSTATPSRTGWVYYSGAGQRQPGGSPTTR